jgi:hypothetical protein
VAQSTDQSAEDSAADGVLPKLIRQEYRLPPDAPREKAISIYALAPYELGKYHPIVEYVGSIPQPGSDPKHFNACSLEEAADQIAKIAEMDKASVLDELKRGPLFEVPDRA